MYIVMKNGEKLKELKTLSAAKKLADAEGGEVYYDGECVYRGTVEAVAQPVTEGAAEQPVAEENTVEPAEENAVQPTAEERPTMGHHTVDRPVQPQMYRLKSLMNVRKKPSMTAPILGTKPVGSVVSVLGIENDWMHLRDGSFILYGNGEFAEKIG